MTCPKDLRKHMENGERARHHFLVKESNNYLLVMIPVTIFLILPSIILHKEILTLYAPVALVLFFSISFFTKRDFAKSGTKKYFLTNKRLILVTKNDVHSVTLKDINRITPTYQKPKNSYHDNKLVKAITISTNTRQIVTLNSLQNPANVYNKIMEALKAQPERSI